MSDAPTNPKSDLYSGRRTTKSETAGRLSDKVNLRFPASEATLAVLLHSNMLVGICPAHIEDDSAPDRQVRIVEAQLKPDTRHQPCWFSLP